MLEAGELRKQGVSLPDKKLVGEVQKLNSDAGLNIPQLETMVQKKKAEINNINSSTLMGLKTFH